MRKLRFALLVIIILYSASAVVPAFAHALLLRSTPEANAVLQKSPPQVELFFSEPLEPELSSVSVYDSDLLIVDAGDVRVDSVDQTRMTVSLRSLPDGVYTVTWKVVSTIDGHQTYGTFPFAVGDANATAVNEIQQSSTARLPFSALLSKFILLASLAILVGQRLFIALIWNPATGSDSSEVGEPAVWATFYRLGLIGALIAIGIGILSQAGQTTGMELLFPWDPAVGRILVETRLGLVWLSRLMLAMFAVWLASRGESRLINWISFATNLCLLFTISLTSHAATEAQPILPILADWIHLVGMTFWFGGLFHLFTGLRQLRELGGHLRTKLTSLLTRRFSANALIFVTLIGATGLYAAYLRVGTLPALLDSLYGHVLLVKQIFVAGLLVIAATNLLVISPRLNRERLQGSANANLVSFFGKVLIFEISFAALLLASVSFLTYLPPAKVPALNYDLVDRVKTNDLRLTLTISPGTVGQNTFTLDIKTSGGQPLSSAKKVLLRFTPEQLDIPPSELELIGNGAGTFSAKGAYFKSPWPLANPVRCAP